MAFEAEWPQLRDGLAQMCRAALGEVRVRDLMRPMARWNHAVAKLVNGSKDDGTKCRIRGAVDAHLREFFARDLASSVHAACDDTELLQAVVRAHRTALAAGKMTDVVFGPADGCLYMGDNDASSLRQFAESLFHTVVLTPPYSRVLDALARLVGTSCDWTLLGDVTRTCAHANIPEDGDLHLCDAYARRRGQLRAAAALTTLVSEGTLAFFAYTREADAEERAFAQRLFGDSAEVMLASVMDAVFERTAPVVIAHETEGVRALFDAREGEALERMLSVFGSNAKARDAFTTALAECARIELTKHTGRGIPPRAPEAIGTSGGQLFPPTGDAFAFFAAFDDVYARCVRAFENSAYAAHVRKALDATFRDACSASFQNRTAAEWLALYAFRPGTSLESNRDRITLIAPFVREQDVFAEVFRRRLATVLLHVGLDDAEAQAASDVAGAICQTEAHRVRRMMADASSPAVMAEDVCARVLARNAWPVLASPSITPPPAMARALIAAERAWAARMPHRAIEWMLAYGSASVSVAIRKKVYDVHMTPIQAAALLVVAHGEPMSAPDIAKALRLDEEHCDRVLNSLSTTPCAVLVCADRVWHVNTAFSSPKTRINVAPVAFEAKQTAARVVENDRTATIDAAIVRAIKAARRMEHRELVQTVSVALAPMFPVEGRTVKKRIEELINREFIDRDGTYYVYAA